MKASVKPEVELAWLMKATHDLCGAFRLLPGRPSGVPLDEDRLRSELPHAAKALAELIAHGHASETLASLGLPPEDVALTRWWSELSAEVDGQDVRNPSTWRYDTLWRAAVHEAAARYFNRLGQEDAARESRATAVCLVADVERELTRT